MPLEGTASGVVHLKDVALADVPTCGLDDTVEVARALAGSWETCVVVNAERIVFGRVFKAELDGDPKARVSEVMRPGTSTFRPNVSATEMLRYMDRRHHDTSLVTTPDGRLVGLVRREDVERSLGHGL